MLSLAGVSERQFWMDAVAIASAHLRFGHVTGILKIAQNCLGRAVGDADGSRDVADLGVGILRDKNEGVSVVSEKGPVGQHDHSVGRWSMR